MEVEEKYDLLILNVMIMFPIFLLVYAPLFSANLSLNEMLTGNVISLSNFKESTNIEIEDNTGEKEEIKHTFNENIYDKNGEINTLYHYKINEKKLVLDYSLNLDDDAVTSIEKIYGKNITITFPYPIKDMENNLFSRDTDNIYSDSYSIYQINGKKLSIGDKKIKQEKYIDTYINKQYKKHVDEFNSYYTKLCLFRFVFILGVISIIINSILVILKKRSVTDLKCKADKLRLRRRDIKMSKIKSLQQFLFSSNSEFIWQDEQLSKRIKKTILLGDILDFISLTLKVILFMTLFFIFKEILISIIKGDETQLNLYGIENTIEVIELICNGFIPFTLCIFIAIKLISYTMQKQAFGSHSIRMILNAICRIYILGPTLLTVSFITIGNTLLILVTCIMISVLNKVSNRISSLEMYARGIRHVGILSTTKLNPIINESSDGIKRSD